MTPGGTDEPTRGAGVRQQVEAAAQELREVEKRHREAATRLAEALLSAHDAGLSWSEVARAAELGSAETARIRAYRAKANANAQPALRSRAERGSTPPPSSPRDGLPVTEAARYLEVSRQTVYAWIRNGKLATTQDGHGRLRVLVDKVERRN